MSAITAIFFCLTDKSEYQWHAASVDYMNFISLDNIDSVCHKSSVLSDDEASKSGDQVQHSVYRVIHLTDSVYES